jgi:hypothetical protein
MRGWEHLESILRTGRSVFFALLAEGDNQRLLGEDGDKLKVVVLLDANSITEHNSDSCHNANPTIVIIFWSIPIHLNYTLPIHNSANCMNICQIQKPQKSLRDFGAS